MNRRKFRAEYQVEITHQFESHLKAYIYYLHSQIYKKFAEPFGITEEQALSLMAEEFFPNAYVLLAFSEVKILDFD
jgi:hypothetical protein